MTCGVYKLEFKGTDKVYIGKSINIEQRFVLHRSKFNRGIHTVKLQNAFNTFGMPVLHILVECTRELLGEAENTAITNNNAMTCGLNSMLQVGASFLPDKDTGKYGYVNPQLVEVLKLLAYSTDKTREEISILTGVSVGVVGTVSACRSTEALYLEYPLEYAIVKKRHKGGKTIKEKGVIYPRILSPQGTYYTVDSASIFAKEHSLNIGHLVQVLRGKEKQHKGWKLESIES